MRGLSLVLNPAHDFFNWSREVDRFFDGGGARSFSPAVDVEETDTAYVVQLDAPGMKKDEIKIELHDRVLTVSGERKSEKTDKEKNYHLTERVVGHFQRRFTLPENIAADKVEAGHEDGVLTIIIPKVEAAKPKLIQIN